MGIKNLNNLISEFTNSDPKNKNSLNKFSGKVFAVDTNLFIYKFLYANGNHINGLFFMINKLSKFNIKPIFVFDGNAPDEKKHTLNNRRKIKYKIIDQVISFKADLDIIENPDKREEITKKILNLEKRLVYVDEDVILSSKKLLKLMGVQYLQAETEAEHLCSNLSRLGIVDGVISDDTDSIACGSNIIIRNFTNKYDYISYYNLNDILYDLDINYDSFLDLCILLGTDYNKKTRNISFKKAYELIKLYKSIDIIEKKTDYNICYNYTNIRQIFKKNYVTPEIIHEIKFFSPDHCSDMRLLILFLEKNSSITKSTFLYRLGKMNANKFKTNNDYLFKYNIYDSQYKIKLKSNLKSNLTNNASF